MRCIVISGQKNYIWIWIIVDRYGKRFVEFVLGKRDKATCKKLLEKVKDKAISWCMTDFGKAYEGVLPTHKHIQSKAETYTVEGYNSLFRHFLARMRRKTKCYTKSPEILRYSLLFLMKKKKQ